MNYLFLPNNNFKPENLWNPILLWIVSLSIRSLNEIKYIIYYCTFGCFLQQEFETIDNKKELFSRPKYTRIWNKFGFPSNCKGMFNIINKFKKDSNFSIILVSGSIKKKGLNTQILEYNLRYLCDLSVFFF